MNRATRRKQAIHIANNVIKGRQLSVAKKQYGLGLVITNLMCVITFGPWTFALWDRRLK